MAGNTRPLTRLVEELTESSLYRLDDYRFKNDTIIFRVSHFIGAIGIIGMFFVLGFAIAAITNISQRSGWIILSIFFSLLSIPIMLIYLVARVYLDEDKLVYRNPVGIKKTIPWQDITEVYVCSRYGDIMVLAGKRKVKLYAYFKGFFLMEAIIREKQGAAFNEDSLYTGKRNGYQHFIREDGSVVLKGRKLYAFIGGAILLVAMGCLFLPVEGSPGPKLALAAFFAIDGMLISLCTFTMRLYMDAEKVAYRNLFGITREIRWQDLKVVRSEDFMRMACVTFTSKDKRKIRIYSGYLDGYEHIGKFARQFNPKKKRKRKT